MIWYETGMATQDKLYWALEDNVSASLPGNFTAALLERCSATLADTLAIGAAFVFHSVLQY